MPRRIDEADARQIAMSDLAPGFAVLTKEQPRVYKFDMKEFEKLHNGELLGLVKKYETHIKNGSGYMGALKKLYVEAKESSIKGFV